MGDRLIVTGASGHLGRAVSADLARLRGSGAGIILTTRHPETLVDAVPGADVRYADFADPATLVPAFTGGTRMLLISTGDLRTRADDQIRAVDAARAAGVQHVVYTSMLNPDPGNPAVIAPSHRATEEHLRRSGLAHTILRAGFYAEFQAFEARDAAASGRLVHNRGAGRCAYISRQDIARAAAAALAEGDRDGQVLDLTGTARWDATALADLYSKALHTRIETVDIGDDELLAVLGGATDGHNQYGARLTVSVGRSIREGFLDVVTDAVETLTGTRPLPLDAVLETMLSALRRS